MNAAAAHSKHPHPRRNLSTVIAISARSPTFSLSLRLTAIGRPDFCPFDWMLHRFGAIWKSGAGSPRLWCLEKNEISLQYGNKSN